MKAVVVQTHAADALHPGFLQDSEIAMPVCGPNDLCVAVKAVSVNPIDLKMATAKPAADATPRVLGWDAAGTVHAIGREVKNFRVGERVYYAGSVLRPGCCSEFHLVDARLAAPAPHTLSWVQAAALPLSSLAAWEALFDRMRIAQEIGGAPGW